MLGKYSSPHLYVPGNEPGTGTMIDLANLAGAMWIDLDTGDMWDQGDVGAPSWFADEARGINESNQIVGNALNGIESERVFVLENPLGPNPIFKLLPRLDDLNVWGLAINDNGVVVGTGGADRCVGSANRSALHSRWYSRPGSFGITRARGNQHSWGHCGWRDGWRAWWGCHFTHWNYPDGSFIYGQNGVDGVHIFEGHDFGGINDSRQISGSRPSTGRGRNRVPGGTVRFQYDPDGENLEDRLVADPFIAESGNDLFSDVNEGGDVAFKLAERTFTWKDLKTPVPTRLINSSCLPRPTTKPNGWPATGPSPMESTIKDRLSFVVMARLDSF